VIASERDLVARFDAAMDDIHARAKRELGYNATRFVVMLRQYDGLQTAHRGLLTCTTHRKARVRTVFVR
jgi:hypothetical protein